jgi:hypothetical protein
VKKIVSHGDGGVNPEIRDDLKQEKMSKKSLIKSTGIIGAATALSRVLGSSGI